MSEIFKAKLTDNTVESESFHLSRFQILSTPPI